MDRMIYTAMSGAKYLLELQAVTAHNLANASTPGFRADTAALRFVDIVGDGMLPTRSLVVGSTPGADLRPGPMMKTGRDLDVAVQGRGWIAVQMADGSEAYTRNGALQVSATGMLQLRDGVAVLGDGGPMAIPPDTLISIARDGTVSAAPATLQKAAIGNVGRIKLVNPDEAQLMKGSDGFFRLRSGGVAPADAGVSLVSSMLENSNVNAVEEMVNMIAGARAFDVQMKLLQNAEANERQASQILSANR